jgi:hypothetical protein
MGVSPWYYDVGMSTKITTEQRARQRAAQNVQANIAATIASDFKARLDLTEYSPFRDCGIEDTERLIETAVTNSIKTRIPGYEPLEWHIETGLSVEGREWYTAYILVRFLRKNILEVVENIEPSTLASSIISNAIKQKIIAEDTEGHTENLEEMFAGVLAAREYAIESIEEGLTGN